ncbi:MAG TPA: cytochrome c-type biogenesis CcmF C-terminal domain-containing protein [Nocardioidaceae bacterium]|nr:cytochrome c-type biogenesis CcmF C-terminal domain-containing protein [Nocardioidaceae bacterium]
MTSWAGMFALALAFCGALLATLMWARAALRGRDRPALWTAALPLAGALGAVGTAEWALLSHDFSMRFVAENGSRATGVYYTVTTLWSAHDGSLLLWLLILTVYVLVVAARRPGPAALHGWAMTVLFGTAAFFAGLTLFTTHVFDTVSPVPADGPGPNPLLVDHPAMGIHPPLLYAGLLGMSIPFAYAVAALITGQVGSTWVRVVRSYTLVAWGVLTAGILVGAWWSYAVLGWGGYWAWDPVENASLMPWLVATALVHSCLVQRKRGALPAWNLSLAVATFLLACLGSFLTRSGVVTSIHSFADSAVGPVLLGFVSALAVGVIVLVLLRADRLGAPRPTGPVVSRGSALLLNNLLLVCLAVTVLIGTLFPLVAEWLSGAQVSVGPPYFDRMAVPIALVLLLLMAVGPMLSWRGEPAAAVLQRVVAPVAVGAVVVLVVTLTAPSSPAPLVTFGLAATVVTAMVLDTAGRVRRGSRVGSRWTRLPRWLASNRRRAAGLVVHTGVVVVVVGIAGSSAYATVQERTLHTGERADVAGVRTELVSVQRTRLRDAMSTSTVLRVDRGGDPSTMRPALRFYPQHDTTVASPAVHSTLTGDVYVTLLSVGGHRTATLRVAQNPLVGWIWGGGAVMVAGALWAMWPGRRTERGSGHRRRPGGSTGRSAGHAAGDSVGPGTAPPREKVPQGVAREPAPEGSPG